MDIIIYSVLLCFLTSLLIGWLLIPLLKRLKLGQNIRKDGPQTHLKKAGTPTFGGIIFIFATTIVILLFLKQFNKETILVLCAFVAFGFIGFLDDFLKKLHKDNEGLTPLQKMTLLLFVSSILALYSYFDPSIGSLILIPFTTKTLELGFIYIPFIIFFYVSTTNAVNLTDGLDGLATTITLLVMTFFTMMSFMMGHNSLAIFCGCLCGGLLGFMRYNSFPAKIFMGDTGSLALGGAIATVAIVLRNPIIVAVVGGIYVIEALSSLLQIITYKLFKKRIFKMAPIHHSFELCGWHETKIVTVFAIITTILCLISLLAF